MDTKVKPKAYAFSLKTPYMKQGRVTQLAARTDKLWLHTKINAEGGENEIHCHVDEDHSFIVLEGQMSVFDETGREMKLGQYQGVMIPKGALYRYVNTGEGNLVVLRVGAGPGGEDHDIGGRDDRLGADGKPLLAGSIENKSLPPIMMDGKFFAESAG
jgi:mannose-6-phosphate isomerase-like protein (cupin superfamily)